MTTKPTSLEAYRDLLAAGIINERSHAVLEFILAHQDDPEYGGMVSRADMEVAFGDTTSSYGPRLVELEHKGLVYVAGTKQSVKTGRTIQGWRVTSEYDPARVTCRADAKQSLTQLADTIRDLVAVAEASLGMSLKDAAATIRMGSTQTPHQLAENN